MNAKRIAANKAFGLSDEQIELFGDIVAQVEELNAEEDEAVAESERLNDAIEAIEAIEMPNWFGDWTASQIFEAVNGCIGPEFEGESYIGIEKAFDLVEGDRELANRIANDYSIDFQGDVADFVHQIGCLMDLERMREDFEADLEKAKEEAQEFVDEVRELYEEFVEAAEENIEAFRAIFPEGFPDDAFERILEGADEVDDASLLAYTIGKWSEEERREFERAEIELACKATAPTRYNSL